jgi:hypothetical protein
MKTIYTLLSILLTSSIYSQTNFLPADSTITWTGARIGFYGGPGNISQSWIQFNVDSTNNDTLINTLNYKKLYIRYGGSNELGHYHTAFRSDTLNQTIYFIPKDSTNEYLFFDFSLNYQLGDTAFIPHYSRFDIISGAYFGLSEIDSNLMDNSYYKTYHFSKLGLVDSLTNTFLPNAVTYASPEIKIAERMITGNSFPFYGVGSFEIFYELSCYQENDIFLWNSGGTCPLLDFTGVKENKQSKIIIYPNPSTGLFTIDTDFIKLNKVTAYDLNGKIVYSKQSLDQKFDVSHLNKGIYILELQSENSTITEKLIIK